MIKHYCPARRGVSVAGADPGSFVPEGFERALAVTGEPPAGKTDLQEECGYADEQTEGVAAVTREKQAEREVNESSYDRLRDIVGQTHAAVGAQRSGKAREPLAVVEQYER